MTKTKKIFTFLVVIAIGLIFAISTHVNRDLAKKKYFKYKFVTGEVVEIVGEKLFQDPLVKWRESGSQKLLVEIKEGEYKGEKVVVINPLSKRHNIKMDVGMKGIFSQSLKNGKPHLWLYNYKMDSYLYILGGLFIFFIVLLGRLSGVKSIISLLFTGVIILFVLIPIIFRGGEPIPWAIFLSFIITLVTFILIGDFNIKTLGAILGTMCGLLVAGFLSFLFSSLARLTGLQMEMGEQVLYLASDYEIKIKGLMFVSILISSLGAIMDVAMSLASAGNELYEHNKNITKFPLLQSSSVFVRVE